MDDEQTNLSTPPSFADLLLAFPGETGDIPDRLRNPVRCLADSRRPRHGAGTAAPAAPTSFDGAQDEGD
jgi:hypothetical protein